MAEYKTIAEELKHIRHVHLWIFVTCSLFFYLVLSSWSEMPFILEELQDFKKVIDEIKKGNNNIIVSENETKINSLVMNFYKQIDTELNGKLGSFNKNNSSYEKVKSVYRNNFIINDSLKQFSDSISIGELKNILANIGLRTKKIIKINIPFKIKEWINENYTEITPVPAANGSYVSSILIENIKFIKYEEKKELGKLAIYLLVKTSFYSTDIQTGDHNNEMSTVKDSAQCVFYTTPGDKLKLPDNWFENNYNFINTSEYGINNKSINEAINDFKKDIGLLLKDNKPDLFGIKILGKDIGYVSIAMIIILMLYLVVYLNSLLGFINRNKIKENIFPIWISIMSGFIPRVLSFITIAALPAYVVVLSLWYLAGVNKIVSALFSLLTFIMGLRCLFLGGKIQKNLFFSENIQ